MQVAGLITVHSIHIWKLLPRGSNRRGSNLVQSTIAFADTLVSFPGPTLFGNGTRDTHAEKQWINVIVALNELQ